MHPDLEMNSKIICFLFWKKCSNMYAPDGQSGVPLIMHLENYLYFLRGGRGGLLEECSSIRQCGQADCCDRRENFVFFPSRSSNLRCQQIVVANEFRTWWGGIALCVCLVRDFKIPRFHDSCQRGQKSMMPKLCFAILIHARRPGFFWAGRRGEVYPTCPIRTDDFTLERGFYRINNVEPN